MPTGVKKSFEYHRETVGARTPEDMQEHTERPGRLRRWSSQLLDGENRWGFARVQIDRFGVTRYRLVVYPPGISDTDRRRLRIWRGSPIWGAALWIVMEIFLQQVTGTWNALAVSSATVVTLVAVALVRIGDTRTMVRTVGVVTMPGHIDAGTIAARDKLKALASVLLDADERVAAERISPIEHEALWWQVYDQLAPNGPAVFDGRWSGRSA
jgi:hypothetical protein